MVHMLYCENLKLCKCVQVGQMTTLKQIPTYIALCAGFFFCGIFLNTLFGWLRSKFIEFFDPCEIMLVTVVKNLTFL